MAGTSDQMMAPAEVAVGGLTGNKYLASEGRADRQAGEAQEKVGKVEEKVEAAIDEVRSIVHPK